MFYRNFVCNICCLAFNDTVLLQNNHFIMHYGYIKYLRSIKFLKVSSTSSVFGRSIFSKNGTWVKKYKKNTRIELEKYWMKRLSAEWLQKKQNKTSTPLTKNKFYCLSMFPYPSGKLHMGHVRVYTISDTMAHFHRMNGKEVLHPMGWDSFGLPAENAALHNKCDPKKWTDENISYMKQQLIDLNLFFDWERELSTCTPKYYRWTQFLFLKLLQAGLAYQKKALVNWDPVDKTVLADEQVDEEGKSWRSGAVVEKRLLKQWFFRTTKYSESLLKSIEELEENYGIKSMQRHWIGKPSGTFVDFKLEVNGEVFEDTFSVFCTHPEYISRSTHINLHSKQLQESTLIFKDLGADLKPEFFNNVTNSLALRNILAINPLTNRKIPFVVSDHKSDEFHSSNILGIPELDEVDMKIASQNDLKVQDDKKIPSREEALKQIQTIGCGHGHMTSSQLRDWLISRQRRWGTPIPVVHCPVHGAVPVKESDLPVLLPNYNEDIETWKQTSCPVCGGKAFRETDTMDTFVDSSWYFMRYTDPNNDSNIFSKETCNQLMPVDLYIGGKEHAILHLYFARFFSHFCADIGLTMHREPFKKLLVQGIIKGKTFRLKKNGMYLAPSEVEEKESRLFEKSTGEEVEVSFEKMSKSKFNGVDPLEFVAEWGITLTRLFVLYAAAPSEVILWDTKSDVIPGMMRWQMKLWRNVGRLIEARRNPVKGQVDFDTEFGLVSQTNRTIETVTSLYEDSCVLSAAITFLMTLARYTANMNDHVVSNSREFERSVCVQIIMSAPMMPHFASELWTGLSSMKYKLNDFDWDKGVLDQRWPNKSDVPQPQSFSVWVDKKYCTRLLIPADEKDQEKIQNIALNNVKVSKLIKNRVVKTVYKPDYIKFVTSAQS